MADLPQPLAALLEPAALDAIDGLDAAFYGAAALLRRGGATIRRPIRRREPRRA